MMIHQLRWMVTPDPTRENENTALRPRVSLTNDDDDDDTTPGTPARRLNIIQARRHISSW